MAECLKPNREQGSGDLFTGGDQHVGLARVWSIAKLFGELKQAIRLAGHRGDDNDDSVALSATSGDPIGNGLDPIGRADRGSTILLNNESHRAPP